MAIQSSSGGSKPSAPKRLVAPEATAAESDGGRDEGLAPGLISLSVRVDPPLPKPARTPQRPRQQQPSGQPRLQPQQQVPPQDSVLDQIKQPTVDPFGN